MPESYAEPVAAVTLVRTRRSRVRDLRGFRKSHQIPEEYNEHTAAFIARIAADDIAEHLEQRFADFRRQLKCRRTDLVVTEPDTGSAAITTPWFEYQIRATLAEDDPTEVAWRWQLAELKAAQQLDSPEIAGLFQGFFDTVEFCPPGSIDIAELIDRLEDVQPAGVVLDYDRQATWCSLQLTKASAVLTVTPDLLSFTIASPPAPAALLNAFLQARSSFVPPINPTIR
ncbi:MAG TPA: hypothetical protein DCR20_07835 [Planctomycetaceae bacterium]|nr:hypothetical protein [Planctomycetaceae bacterium]